LRDNRRNGNGGGGGGGGPSSYRGVMFGPSSSSSSSIGGLLDRSITFANPHGCELATFDAEAMDVVVDAPREGLGVEDGKDDATGIVHKRANWYDPATMESEQRRLRQVSDELDEDIMPSLPPLHTIPFPGGCCSSFNRAQKEEAELLKAMFKDHVKFPTLQRGSDGNVIVDFHPE